MQLLNKIVNTGVTDVLSFPSKRKVILLNYLCVITSFLLLVVYLPVNALIGLPMFFYAMNLLGLGVLSTCVYLNYIGKYNSARIFSCTALLIFVNGFSILTGEGTGTEYINIVLCILPLVIFDKKRIILLFSLLSFLFFIACKIVFVYAEPFYPHHNADFLFYINLFVIFFSVFYLLSRFKKEVIDYSILIEQQHEEILQKNKEITDSIRYATNIQNAVIGNPDMKLGLFNDIFVLFRPKDIVSGDFWAITEIDGKKIIIAADCTGHGVPGALMTIMGKIFLEEIIHTEHITSPDKILVELDKRISKIFKKEMNEQAVNDGMDISILCLDNEIRKIYFASAHHSLYHASNNKLLEIKGSDFPIGCSELYQNKKFELHTIDISPEDQFYLSTDGYADQFGGENDKKFTRKRLKELLLAMYNQPLELQSTKLLEAHLNWKNTNEQTDDLLVISIKV